MAHKNLNTCAVTGCDNEIKARELCPKHYKRLRTHGDANKVKPKGGASRKIYEFCTMDDCDNKHLAKGFCSKHYRAFVAWVDKDREECNRKQINPFRDSGYVTLYLPNHPNCSVYGVIMEHRVVMEKMIGRYLEPHENVHHKNGDRADNRPENLELWSRKQPPGQRIEDKVDYAMDILKLYAPDLLAGN